MGEAKRRKASQQWDNDLLQIHNQAKGVLDVYIVHTHDTFRLLRASISGNQNASAIMRAIAHCGVEVTKAATTQKPALCLCCPREITDPIPCTFCITIPSGDELTKAMSSVICPPCSKASDLCAKVTQAYRAIWPELRHIHPVPYGGNA